MKWDTNGDCHQIDFGGLDHGAVVIESHGNAVHLGRLFGGFPVGSADGHQFVLWQGL